MTRKLAGGLVPAVNASDHDSRRSHNLVLSSKLGWIGVDLGTHTVKLAQAVRTPEGVRLRHAAVIQRPSPWPDADALALDEPDPSWPEILAALECGDFRGRSAACLLPMNVCELRGLKIPQGDVHERRAMIASELADDEAERDRPLEFDYWELGGEKGIETSEGFNVNVMSVTRPWIDQVAADCQRVRLDCWAVDGAPLAMARAVGLAAGPRNGDRAVAVDWGFSNTTHHGGRQGTTALRPAAARLPLPQMPRGDSKTRSASRATTPSTWSTSTGLSPPSAECKLRCGPANTEIQAAITAAIAEVTASLVEQIERTLRFVEQQRRHQHPAALWLMGGGASVRNIGPHLAAALRLPVSIWGLPPERDVRSAARRSASRAVRARPGPLRLGVEGRMKTAINLLPPVYRRQRLVRRRVIQWSVVLVAALSTIGAACWYKDHEYRVLQRQLAAVARESRPAQTMLREIDPMRKQIEKLQQHQSIAQELEQQRQVLALLGVVSQAARQTAGSPARRRLSRRRLAGHRSRRESGRRHACIAGTVTLVGVALDSPTVAEFHDGLMRSGLFADVKLIKSNERTSSVPSCSITKSAVSCNASLSNP